MAETVAAPQDPEAAFAPHRPIPLRDRGLLVILGAALVGQLLTLARIDGYQLADAVEYMDRANMVVNGESFDPRTPRPFTFSGLLSPLFWIAKAVELESFAVVVGLVRVIQMLVGLATIWVTARIGSRIGGHRLGLASAIFCAANIAFLRYTVSPVSDPEAMLFLALGVEWVLRGRSRKQGLVTGFLLGVSILFAYKSAPMAGSLLLGIFLRERFRYFAWLRSVALGVFVCIAVGAAADTRVYGDFGSSIGGYIVVNVVSILSKAVYHAGFEDEGRWLYNNFSGAEQIDQVKSMAGDFRSMDEQSWYLENFHTEFYSAPLLALLVLGMLGALRRIRYPQTLFLFVAVFNFVLLNNKGYKDFRLFLPILPMICVLGALGWQSMRGYTTVAPGGNLLRSVFAGLVMFVGVMMVPGKIRELNLREHSGYWRAMDIVNEEARREREELRAQGLDAPPRRVGSAYHWAVSLRQTRDVQLIRLPMEMVTWVRREDRPKYDPVREKLLTDIESFDWFLAHMQVLWQSPDIMEVVNGTFEIHTLLYDSQVYEGLAPICVMRRRTGASDARTFYDVFPDRSADEAAAYAAGLQHPVRLPFRHQTADGGIQEIELLGWDVEVGHGGGDLAWITFHWYARTDGIEDFAFLDRVTDVDGSAGLVGLDGHRPAYAVHDTSGWRAGTILRESYPRMVPRHPRLFGGDNLRGDVVPAALWMAVQRSEEGSESFARMVPWNVAEDRPAEVFRPSGPIENYMWPHDGYLWDAAGRVHVGGFWLPVPPELRVPDDGRPLPPLAVGGPAG